MSTSLDGFRFCLFGLSPSRKALLLRPIMRTRFQFIVLTLVAVEVQDRLCVLGLRHGASPVEIVLAGAAYEPYAGASASSDSSASCYGFTKDIRVLSVIVAKLKLGQIQWQILFADVMELAHDAALQERPERFDVVGMHLATNVFAFAVADRFVRETGFEPAITGLFVGCYQVNFVADGLADKAIQGPCVGIFDYLADHVALAANGSDDSDFAATLATANVCLLVPMPVLVLTTNKGFIHFDDAHKLAEVRIVHSSSEPVSNVPCRMCGRPFTKKYSSKLQRRDAFFALEHGVEHFEPRQKLHIRVLKHGSNQHGKTIRTIVSVGFITALPCERTGRAFIDLGVPTFGTLRTKWPTSHRQIGSTRRFIRERCHEFLKGHHTQKYCPKWDCSKVPSYPLEKALPICSLF
jgi:hypothetical protein